ncbi:MAG: FHA domain-containing protein [Anaerolineae bacterium]|nr:FHA domain-containing protein [Anaerolineae bacterium]
MTLVRGWEAREGQNYKPARSDHHEADLSDTDELTEETQDMSNPKRKVIRRIQPPDSPAVEKSQASVVCPNCHKVNPPGEAYCYSCGTLLTQPGGTADLGHTRPVAAQEEVDTYFDDHMVLYLQVRGATQMIRVRPREDEMIVGRTAPDAVMLPEIDLTPYSADTKGVSRMHAAIRRQEDTLVLADLGSLNKTYINNQRLHPHEVRVLHNGDEIRFGHLSVRVFFRQG